MYQKASENRTLIDSEKMLKWIIWRIESVFRIFAVG